MKIPNILVKPKKQRFMTSLIFSMSVLVSLEYSLMWDADFIMKLLRSKQHITKLK